MRRLNLKLAIMLLALFFVTSAMAQWDLSCNGLTSTPKYFIGSTSAQDIDFRYDATNGSGGSGSAVGVQAGLLDNNNTSWGVGSLIAVFRVLAQEAQEVL